MLLLSSTAQRQNFRAVVRTLGMLGVQRRQRHSAMIHKQDCKHLFWGTGGVWYLQVECRGNFSPGEVMTTET
jgi:hypothetical protein